MDAERPDRPAAGVQSTWATRELPILAAAFRKVEAGDTSINQLATICEEPGLAPRELLAGLGALQSADPPYLEVDYGGGWSDERAGGGYVSEVSERARRELGAWPTADGLLEQLVAALVREAEEEPEPERRGRLRNAADVLGGAARDIAVSVISARLGRID